MASSKPVKVDAKELEKAQKLWENFGIASKWGIIATIVVLVGLAILTL